MKKREFLQLMTGGSLSLLAAPLFTNCESNRPQEIKKFPLTKGLPNNWIWLRPQLGQSDDYWKAAFARIRSAGIEAVLPQVYASNDTLFDHPTLPVKERWLEHILPLAHAEGLQVHAWMWTMPLNNPEMLQKHPDWYAVNRNGEPATTHPAYVDYYKFMCPCHPEVPEFVAGNVEALAKIEDLDGIHIDYVRLPDVILAAGLQPKYDIVQDKEYPEYDYSYSENCRNQFKEKYGVDPLALEDPTASEEWRQFRYDAISNIVNNYVVPTAKKYGKPVTAAVFPNWESVRQQWHTWNLDGFLPMLYQGFYNEDIAWIGEEVKKARQRLLSVQNDKPVFSGLFLEHLSPEELAETMDLVKQAGAQGISLFSYGNMSERDWAVLEEKLVAGEK